MPDIDRVKVIKGLEEAYKVIEDYVPSRYRGYSRLACCDAIDLLREQEPIKPIFPHNVPAFPRCGACLNMLVGPPLTANSEIKYCWSCGRAVKWK